MSWADSMTSALMGSGGHGIRFSMLGFPVRIDWSFFLVALLFAITFPRGPTFVVVLMVVIAVSVLVHELGHAFAAGSLGAKPSIVINGIGGYTAYLPPEQPTRLEAIGVALAGPLAGACLGLLVLMGQSIFGDPVPNSLMDDAVRMAIAVNIGYGLINLAPVLPLDGGHVLEQLLPGSPSKRRRTAAIISVVLGTIGAVVLYNAELTFFALMLAMLVFTNFATLRSTRDGGLSIELDDALARMRTGDVAAAEEVAAAAKADTDRSRQVGLATVVVEFHLALGDVSAARRFADELPTAVPPPLHDLIDVYGGHSDALDNLSREVLTVGDALSVRCAVHGFLAARRADEVPALLAAAPDEARRLGVLRDAHLRLHHDRSYGAAASVGELMLSSHPEAEAMSWYNVACSMARAGHTRRAVAYLQRASELGWNSPSDLDNDPDLASVRSEPDWMMLRSTLA
jgi:Zn-dependent protease